MIRILTYIFFAIWIAMAAFLFLIPNADAQEGPRAQLYQKPVLCAATSDQAVEMLSQVKKDGMLPLMYFRGNSFNGDGSKFNADFFILFNPQESIITFLEIQPNNGFTCLISGGTGNVEFNPKTIADLLGWDNIQ